MTEVIQGRIRLGDNRFGCCTHSSPNPVVLVSKTKIAKIFCKIFCKIFGTSTKTLVIPLLELQFKNRAHGWIAESQELLLSPCGLNLDNFKGIQWPPKDTYFYRRINISISANLTILVLPLKRLLFHYWSSDLKIEHMGE